MGMVHPSHRNADAEDCEDGEIRMISASASQGTGHVFLLL